MSMSRLSRFLPVTGTPSSLRFAPRVEALDDRIVPSLFTMLASQQTDGTQGTSAASQSAVSADGRYIAFITQSKLVAEDTNAFADVYRMDSATGTVILISRADGAAGAVGNQAVVFRPGISADGRFVSFDSNASNLTLGDANATLDVFVRDTVANTTKLVSVSTAGVQGNNQSGISSISADGTKIAFASIATNLVATDPNANTDVLLRDLTANTTTLVSSDSAGVVGDNLSTYSQISGDGKFVVFESVATNLVLNDTNAARDVFLKNLSTGATTRVSVASDGTQGIGNSGGTNGQSINFDGTVIAFESAATNLVANDTNAFSDIFVRQTATSTTTRVSTDASGIQGNNASNTPSVSANGRFIAFASQSSNLVTGDTNALNDIFVKDRIAGAITRASVASDGTQSNAASFAPSINRTGTRVSFDSAATNLFSPDANAVGDVFVRVLPLPAGFVAAPGATGSSQVRVFNADGSQRFSFFAYDPGYTGGAFVSQGDVSGDGVADIVTSTGKGGTANIRVFNGVTGDLTASFFAYPTAFTGGVNVAIGDVNNDGYADIVCGVGVGGGPNIRILDGRQVGLGNFTLSPLASGGALLASFFAYPEGFTGGVRVAIGDVNGDGFADVICGVGSGGGPNVRVLDGRQMSLGNVSLGAVADGGALISSFFAQPSTFFGGLFVSAGDVDNDGFADVIAGVESGGGPNVRAFNATTQTQLRSFFGFDSGLTSGVRVGSTDFNQDGFDDFILGSGPGNSSLLRITSGKDSATQLFPQFAPFGGFAGGVNVG